MKIVVVARCLNEERNIERFVRCYSFADLIVISDGGSTDNSIKLLEQYKKVKIVHFDEKVPYEHGHYNPDNSHLNFVINAGKEYEPDWLILDDMDDMPNYLLAGDARYLFNEIIAEPQVNAYRLYMWNENKYFPKMNKDFHPDYSSLWGWKPKEVNVRADEARTHGTLIGLSNRYTKLSPPYCLLHFSWGDNLIEEKKKRYAAMDINFQHPFDMEDAKTPVDIPEWARI